MGGGVVHYLSFAEEQIKRKGISCIRTISALMKEDTIEKIYYHQDVIEARKTKMKRIKEILNLDAPHVIQEDGKYNFLTEELIENSKIVDTENVSSNDYDYFGLEKDDSLLILDCGCGLRKNYYHNVVCFEICDYISTDVLGVGECLPFKDNSFDAVFSFAVLEHVTDPKQCASELIRVLKPGGKIYCDAVFMQPYHGYPSHYFNMTPSGSALLFENGCDIISQTIPFSFHPIYSLHWICKLWKSGLEGKALEDFNNITIGELLKHQPIEYKEVSFVKDLPMDTQKLIAAGTRVVAVKKE